MSLFRGRRVLVTGGTGMIGRVLVEMLVEYGARVRIASLDDPSRAHPEAEFRRANLLHLEECLSVCQNLEFVFHVAGIKGSPAMTSQKPASFFVPLLMMNTNMMEAARRVGADRYLFTSSIGVYGPAETMSEDDVWKTFPSENDRFAGWAKRMGELQAEAYQIEFGWDRAAIVRPANVYGRYDNFDPRNAMVIPSLIRRVGEGENPLVVWGDGSAVRDFIHASDVARAMLLVMEAMPGAPVNVGSGEGVSIRSLVEALSRIARPAPDVVWDTSKPGGDRRRVLDTSRLKALGFTPQVSLESGLADTLEWYREQGTIAHHRYNVFVDGLAPRP